MLQETHFEYHLEKKIPYFEETQKRSFFEKIKKVKNTILLILAYAFPSSKWRVILHRARGVHIGKGCYIGMFCFIDNLYPQYIYIEDNASVNTGSMLIAHFNPSIRFSKVFEARVSPIVIKNGAMVAVNCVIFPGVTIGENAIVSAGTVVSQSVEASTLVRSNYAMKVGKIPL